LRICADGAVPEFHVSESHGSRCWLLHPQVAGTGVMADASDDMRGAL
jgi:hypothetical protein